MNPYVAILCASVLLIAAVLEICAMKEGAKMIGLLSAFGLGMLAARYSFIIYTGDLARLNLYGTASIGAIALARIMACAEELRK